MTWTEISDAEHLTALFGSPSQRAANKDRSALHPMDRRWLAASPFCLVGTADADGRCDVSPKGDPAGRLVHVLDSSTIAIAERPGNKRMDGYRIVLENPFVGIEQVFFHCAKAFMRSQLWEPQTWDPAVLPTVAAITKAVMPDSPETLDELEQYYGSSYQEQLYQEK